jgi:hypothetical protein
MFSRPFTRVRYLGLPLLCLLIGLTATGCSSSQATVTGKITYKNAPLKNGSISFQAADGKTYGTEIQGDGTYSVKVAPGDAKVAISSIDEGKAAEVRKKLKDMRENPKGGAPKTFSPQDFGRGGATLIPPKYGDFDKSGLTKNIKSGVNKDVDFNLTD